MLGQTRNQPNTLEPYLGFYQDGLLDIALGLGLLLAALVIAMDASWFFFIPVALIPLWPSLRKSVIAPRLKGFSLSEGQLTRIARAKRIMTMSLAGITLLLAVLMVLRATDLLPVPNQSSWAVMAVVVAVVLAGLLAVMGYAYGLKRMYVYTGLAALAMIGVAVFKFSLAWSLAILGAVMLLTGLNLLVRFLREHPLPK